MSFMPRPKKIVKLNCRFCNKEMERPLRNYSEEKELKFNME